MSAIFTLPNEILEIIASHVSLENLQNLRLVSSRMSNVSLKAFVLCFSEISTIISHSSLQKVLQISRHPDFRNHVKILHIRSFMSERGDGKEFSSWARNESNGPFPQHHNEVLHPLQIPNVACEILNSILKDGLPNCRGIYLDLNKTIADAIYWDDLPTNLNAADELYIALSAIGATGGPIKKFAIEYTETDFNFSRINLAVLQSEGFNRAWAALECLKLGYAVDNANLIRDGETIIHLTITLLKQANNLRRLDFGADRQEGWESFAPLTSNFVRDHPAAKFEMRSLEHLVLRNQYVDIDTLSKFLYCSRDTLRHISLIGICLRGGETWSSLLRHMHTLCPKLRSISISNVSEDKLCVSFEGLLSNTTIPGTKGRKIKIDGSVSTQKFEQCVWSVSYKGSSMSEALEMLASIAVGVTLAQRVLRCLEWWS